VQPSGSVPSFSILIGQRRHLGRLSQHFFLGTSRFDDVPFPAPFFPTRPA